MALLVSVLVRAAVVMSLSTHGGAFLLVSPCSRFAVVHPRHCLYRHPSLTDRDASTIYREDLPNNPLFPVTAASPPASSRRIAHPIRGQFPGIGLGLRFCGAPTLAAMRIRIVDAFSARPFAGNPAGVVLLDSDAFPDDAWLQRVAAEVNLSETCLCV